MSKKLFLLILYLSLVLVISHASQSSWAEIDDLSRTSTQGFSAQTSQTRFLENVGQYSNQVLFFAQDSNTTLWLTKNSIWITILESSPVSNVHSGLASDLIGIESEFDYEVDDNSAHLGVNIRLSFEDANPEPGLHAFNPVTNVTSFFIGSDSDDWSNASNAWGGVRYSDLYDGIDLEISGNGTPFLLRFVCSQDRCKEDLAQVRLNVEGAESQTLANDGFFFETDVGNLYLPVVSELSGQGRLNDIIALKSGGEILDDSMATVTDVTESRTLILPVDRPDALLFSTFIGGNDNDAGYGIDVDGQGNVYVTGCTDSGNFPSSPGLFESTQNNCWENGFISKLNPSGTELLYSVILVGGIARDIAVDNLGRAYVTGSAGGDAYVLKLNAAGNTLIYGTAIGGSRTDSGTAIAVDEGARAYIVGNTHSADFPTTPGAYDTTYNYDRDVFVLKLNAAGQALDFSTFIGSTGDDTANDIAINSTAHVYVTGYTLSSNFPTTSGSFDVSHGGVNDAFALALNSTGSDLIYSTFLGDSGDDKGYAIAVDETGHAFVAGVTNSEDFPTTPGAFSTTKSLFDDGFVVKLNPLGSQLDYSTFIGGSSIEHGRGIDIDGSGNAYITGETGSEDFPTTPGAFLTNAVDQDDVFLSMLNSSGSEMVYSTYLGGSYADNGYAIALDGPFIAHITGNTFSPDFPVTPDAYDTTISYIFDVFVVKMNTAPVLDINYYSGAPGSYFAISGFNYLPNSNLSIFVNNNYLGSVASESDGVISFLLSTAASDEGVYLVRVGAGNYTATTRFVLDYSKPLRPQQGSGPIFDVPAGIGLDPRVFLSVVVRGYMMP